MRTGASNVTSDRSSDRQSVSGSIESEQTTSSCDIMTRGPTMAPGGMIGLVGGGSGSSIGDRSEISPSPQMNLRMENLIEQVKGRNGER